MDVGKHRKTVLRWIDVIRKYMNEGERSKHRRRTTPENVEIENSMRRTQIGKRPRKKMN